MQDGRAVANRPVPARGPVLLRAARDEGRVRRIRELQTTELSDTTDRQGSLPVLTATGPHAVPSVSNEERNPAHPYGEEDSRAPAKLGDPYQLHVHHAPQAIDALYDDQRALCLQRTGVPLEREDAGGCVRPRELDVLARPTEINGTGAPPLARPMGSGPPRVCTATQPASWTSTVASVELLSSKAYRRTAPVAASSSVGGHVGSHRLGARSPISAANRSRGPPTRRFEGARSGSSVADASRTAFPDAPTFAVPAACVGPLAWGRGWVVQQIDGLWRVIAEIE